jgi:hypothetical protein
MRALMIAVPAALLFMVAAAIATTPPAPGRGRPTVPSSVAARELERRAGDFVWRDAELSDVVELLRHACDANFFIDPGGLKDAGVRPDAPVRIKVGDDGTNRDVLAQALTQAGKGTRNAELSFATTDDFVIISTAARAKALAAALRADAGRGTTEADRAALARPVPDDTRWVLGLDEVMEVAAQASGSAVAPDWEQLATVGLQPDDTVTVRLRGVTVAQYLRIALEEAPPTEPVAFVVTDGRIRVSSRAAVSAEIRELDAATKARAKAKATTPPRAPADSEAPAAPAG